MLRMFEMGSKIRHPSSFLVQFRLHHIRQCTIKSKSVTFPSVKLKNIVNSLSVPNVKFFSDLKLEENKQFHHIKRKRMGYKDNQTAALALPYSQKKLANKVHDQKALLELSKTQIVEHANRRIDLFFYTLVAYYNKGVLPAQGHTYLQYGRGRSTKSKVNITQACHSSFIPSLIDETVYQSQAEAKHRSILDNTHFERSLNATVELPYFVNELDNELENHFSCRQKSLEIIREVSMGTINPIQGLNKFLLMMRDALNELEGKQEAQACLKKSKNMLFGHKHVSAELIAFVKKGTFATTFSNKTQSVDHDYIQLLLRMTPDEKLLCEDVEFRNVIYMKKMKEMQQEILESKREPRNTVK